MKKILKILFVVTVIVSIASVSSCKKDDAKPSYELRFTNASDNPYKVEIDGTSSILQGLTFKNYVLEQGTYSWKVTQQSGYLLFPTIKEGTITLNQDKEILFP